MNKQQLAAKIWASANQMRSKIEANEYKDYILGFIFYKYLSDKEVRFLKEEGYTDEELPSVTEEDAEVVEWVQKNTGYFIAYNDLFSTWLKIGRDFDVSNVRDALSAFSRLISPTHKKVFDKIFDTLQTGLSKLGENAASQTKAISGLLQLISDIPMDGKQDYDVLGFIYEYLISNFAANAGKKAGEFYTPHEVSLLMSEIVASHLNGRNEIKIYDPTSGSGSLLINIGRSVSKYISDDDNIKYYAQELKENTYNLTRMNLVMRGIKPDNIVTRNGDTLEEDWPYFDENDPANTYDPLYVDSVVSNPPYSQQWDPTNKDTDPRYARFGLAPKGKADYAFLLHDLYHLKPHGIMTIVLPHGVLFRGGEEGEIRKNLIENNHIDAIIGLPSNIFFGTGIPTIIMILKQKREHTNILVIDASKGFIKEGKNNKLRASDIKRIVDTVAKRESIDKFSRVVTREEVRGNEYNLNIPRYVDSSKEADSWDIYASMFGGIPKSEIDALSDYWEAFPSLKKTLFVYHGTPYVELITEDVKSVIKEHNDVVSFKKKYQDAFANFPEYFKSKLIDNMQSISITQAETELSEHIFSCLSGIPLVDKYVAFQLLDDEWEKISIDLEILQSEGIDALKKVDPHLVVKKKGNKEQETQDGWIGRIIPFELVQSTLLKEEYNALTNKKLRLTEIPSNVENILDSISDDERELCADALTDENDAFVTRELAKIIKALKNDKSDEAIKCLKKLEQASALFSDEKKLKSEIKSDSAALQAKTKDCIESFADDEAMDLLKKKWIDPLVASLHAIPDTIADNLVTAILALAKKYDTTFYEVEKEIKETEQSLATMIDELEGSEFDMKGLSEFKKLILGEING